MVTNGKSRWHSGFEGWLSVVGCRLWGVGRLFRRIIADRSQRHDVADYFSKLAYNTFSQPLKRRKKAPTRPAENQSAQWSEGEEMAKKKTKSDRRVRKSIDITLQ